MAKVADELVIPVSKYPRRPALPVLVPRATLPPQSAIWSIIILISLNCISEGPGGKKGCLSKQEPRLCSQPPCTSESEYRGRQHDPCSPPPPPHTPPLPSSFDSLSSFAPFSSRPSFLSFHIFLPRRFALSDAGWNLQKTLEMLPTACRIWKVCLFIFLSPQQLGGLSPARFWTSCNVNNSPKVTSQYRSFSLPARQIWQLGQSLSILWQS